MQQLADRVAWITGAASGIGLALAHRLAAERMKLVLVDVEEGALAAAETALRASGATVLAIRADASDGTQMAAAARRALDTFGLVHLIVNNAGVGGGGGPMWELTEADWKWTFDVNVWGVIHGIRLLLAPLVASGEEGHVVNTASIAGLLTPPFMAPYVATKHAVVALSECLAKELELSGSKVGVSVLCPAWVKTQIAQSHRNRPSELAATATGSTAKQFAGMLQQLVASGVSPESIAEAVVTAVRESRFYILTHPEATSQVEYRFEQILAGEKPGIDPKFRAAFSKKP